MVDEVSHPIRSSTNMLENGLLSTHEHYPGLQADIALQSR